MEQINAKNRVSIIDTTLRDGLQHEEHYVPLEDRIRIVNELLAAGITRIEAGSFSHPAYLPQFRQIEDLIAMLPEQDGVEYTFLALNRRAVERALDLKQKGAPIHRILTGQIATSESYARKNMNRSHEELFQEAKELVAMLHEGGIPKVAANVGTIFGCPIEGKMPLERAYEFAERLFDMGFDEIEHSDPDGAASPEMIEEYCGEILRRWPDPSRHVLHIHDIHGMGLACYYAALKQGIRQFECTLGGIGGQPANQIDGVPVRGTGEYYFEHGRTGLVSTEDFVWMLKETKYSLDVSPEQLISAGLCAEQVCRRSLDSFVVANLRK